MGARCQNVAFQTEKAGRKTPMENVATIIGSLALAMKNRSLWKRLQDIEKTVDYVDKCEIKRSVLCISLFACRSRSLSVVIPADRISPVENMALCNCVPLHISCFPPVQLGTHPCLKLTYWLDFKRGLSRMVVFHSDIAQVWLSRFAAGSTCMFMPYQEFSTSVENDVENLNGCSG
jgi:hypothetical protein